MRVLLMIMWGAADATIRENLVRNADFAERDAAGHPTHWVCNWREWSLTGNSSVLAYNGSGGAATSCVEFSQDDPCWCTQRLPSVMPGRRYDVSAHVLLGGTLSLGSVGIQYTLAGTTTTNPYAFSGGVFAAPPNTSAIPKPRWTKVGCMGCSPRGRGASPLQE